MMIMGFSAVNVLIQCFLLHTKMMINTKNKKVLYVFLKTYYIFLHFSAVSHNSTLFLLLVIFFISSCRDTKLKPRVMAKKRKRNQR